MLNNFVELLQLFRSSFYSSLVHRCTSQGRGR